MLGRMHCMLMDLLMLGRMHCMLMDLLHGFEVLSTTEETLTKMVFQLHSVN